MIIHEVGYFTSLLLTFTVSLIVCLIVSKWLRERNYPPGPMGLPFIGYGIFLGAKPQVKLRDLGKKYGDVLSFYQGTTLHICINNFHLAKEVLTNPLALARPEHALDFMTGKGGLGGMSGEEWQEQRRFAFYTMRNLGLGKGAWETMIQESAVDFIEEVKSWKGKPSKFEDVLTFFQASNSIALLIGRHLDKEKDADNIEIIHKSTREFMGYFSSLSVSMSIPGLDKLLAFFQLAGYDKFFSLLRKFENIFKKEVEERMKNPKSLTKDDFIGCYFKEMEKKDYESKKHTFTVTTLIGNLIVLFIAGNESTMASIAWLLLLMAEHQDIQKKIHHEIDNVVGRDGVPSYDDRNKFPYTMATILEMTRWVALSSLFPPRCATADIAVNGYTIPRGARIIANGWAIMQDPKYYKNPTEFKPERFLSQNGEKVIKSDGYAAFSLGKRNCPGEGVAIMTIFLYFISLMQKFHVKIPPGSKVDLDPIFGGTMLTKPQNTCFIER